MITDSCTILHRRLQSLQSRTLPATSIQTNRCCFCGASHSHWRSVSTLPCRRPNYYKGIIMQRLLSFLPCLLLLLCTPVLAGGQEVPLLKEWYHFNSTGQLVICGPLVYLPNFDTANGGYHATAMYVHRGENPNGCFAIILGAPLRTVGVPEPVAGYTNRTFDMQQNYPNPVAADRKTSLPLTVQTTQHLTLELYTLQGQFISTLFTGTLAEGTHTLPLDLTPYTLPRGMYVLRLIGEHGSRQRALLID